MSSQEQNRELTEAELLAEVEELERLTNELETRAIERDLRKFIPLAWPYVEPNRPYVHNWHIDAIADHLMACSEGHIKKLVINIPPRHMKSMTVSVFWPAWEWATNPQTKWLFIAYGRNLVIRDSVKTRRIIASSWYKKLWGHVYRLAGDQNVKSYYENTQGGHRLIGSIDGGVTGEGGDRLVIDDPLKIEDADNPTAIESVNDFWDGVLSSRLNDPKTGIRVMIMQRLHDNDLTGHVLREGGWTHLFLPTEYEEARKCITTFKRTLVDPISGDKRVVEKQFKDPRTVEGDLLNPKRFGPDEVMVTKIQLGPWKYAGQQQQRPVPQGGGMYRKEWWRFYDVNMMPHQADMEQDCCQSWDCSFKNVETSSYVVGLASARIGIHIYILGLDRRRLNFPETLAAIRGMSNLYPWIGAKLVEDKANGTAVIAVLKNEIPGIIERDPGPGGIEALASATSYMPAAGNVLLPGKRNAEGKLEPAFPWVDEFMSECEGFPKAQFNDQVAALAHALYWYHERPVGGNQLMDLLNEGKVEVPNDPMGWIF